MKMYMHHNSSMNLVFSNNFKCITENQIVYPFLCECECFCRSLTYLLKFNYEICRFYILRNSLFFSTSIMINMCCIIERNTIHDKTLRFVTITYMPVYPFLCECECFCRSLFVILSFLIWSLCSS
jgi:hypothetical protein